MSFLTGDLGENIESLLHTLERIADSLERLETHVTRAAEYEKLRRNGVFGPQ